MNIYEVGPFQLVADQLLLTRAGTPVALGPKVVETLLALVEHPDEVVAKAALVDRIWPDGFVEEANLVQNIHVLRKTFHLNGSGNPIETVPRRGYRLTAPVRHVAAAALTPSSVSPAPIARRPVARGLKASLSRALAVVLASATFVAASVLLVATNGPGHRGAPTGELSGNGAQLYQIGSYYWNLRTREGVRTSLRYFAAVIDTDPRNPRGYAALADANVAMGDYCYGTHRPDVYFARAREYARKALALDPNSPAAHAVLGLLALTRNDATGSVVELRRAIALDPSYAPAHEWYGIALVERGSVPEGVAHLKLAAELDPLSVATIAWLGSAAYRDGRFGDAVAYAREALELSPRRIDVLATLGEAYEAQGDIERAVEAFKRYAAVGPYYRPAAAALLARAYARGHRLPEARAALEFARAHARDVDPFDLTAAAAALDPRGARRPELRTHHTATYA